MDKGLRTKLIIVIALLAVLVLATGYIQLQMEIPRDLEMERAKCQMKLDAVAEVVRSVEETRKTSKASFEEHLHENISLMTATLADEVTGDGYAGPVLFEDGAVVLLRGEKAAWPEGVPAGFPELKKEDLQSGEIFSADIPARTDQSAEGESSTKRMIFLAGKISGDYYYVDWTDEEEILTDQYATLRDEDFLKVARDTFGGNLIFVSSRETELSRFWDSAIWKTTEGAAKLGFTPEVIAERRPVVDVNGVRAICCYADMDGGAATMIYLKPADDMYTHAFLHVGMIQLSMFVVLATLVIYIYAVRQHVRTRRLSRVLLSRYKPKTFRRVIIMAGITGALAVFIVTSTFQTLDVLHEESIVGAKSISQLFEYLQDSTTERLAYDKEQEAEWDIYQGQRLAELIAQHPETGTREKLQEYSDILNIDYIMLFDAQGRETVTNSRFTGLTLDAGLGENSADFKRLLNGVPGIVHDASADPVTGEIHQMIGVPVPSAEGPGAAPSGALIMAVPPKTIVKSSEELSRQLQFVDKGDKVCFFTDQENGKILYANDESLIGKTVVECGMPAKSLQPGYTDFTNLNGVPSYVTMVRQAAVNFYYVFPTRALFSHSMYAPTTGLIVFLVILGILAGISLSGYTEENFKKWSSANQGQLDEGDEQELRQSQSSYTELLVSRSRSRLKLGNKTPEVWATVVMKLDVLLLVVIPALFYVLGGRLSADHGSLINYVLYGDWMRGFSLFALSGILTVATASLLILLICNGVLSLIAGFTGRGGETLCRLLYSLARYIAVLAIMYYIFEYVGLSMSTYIASLGTVSLALSIGSRDMVADIVAGVMILFERQFQVGDIVEIDGYRGQVLEMGVRSTKLLCQGDDIRFISNSNIRSIINKTKRLSTYTTELAIVTTEPLEKVEELFNRELPEIAQKKLMIKDLKLGGIARVTGGGNPESARCVSVRIKWVCREGDQETVRDFITREIYLLCEREHIEVR